MLQPLGAAHDVLEAYRSSTSRFCLHTVGDDSSHCRTVSTTPRTNYGVICARGASHTELGATAVFTETLMPEAVATRVHTRAVIEQLLLLRVRLWSFLKRRSPLTAITKHIHDVAEEADIGRKSLQEIGLTMCIDVLD